MREKSEKDKELQRLRQGHERLEGRLSSANSERAAGLARCAQLEQEARDAKRGLDVLQKQVSPPFVEDCLIGLVVRCPY